MATDGVIVVPAFAGELYGIVYQLEPGIYELNISIGRDLTHANAHAVEVTIQGSMGPELLLLHEHLTRPAVGFNRMMMLPVYRRVAAGQPLEYLAWGSVIHVRVVDTLGAQVAYDPPLGEVSLTIQHIANTSDRDAAQLAGTYSAAATRQ